MPDAISGPDLNDFNIKLQGFRETLTDSQKPLLDAILATAWRLTRTQDDLDMAFDDGFTADAAALVFQYASAPMTSGLTIHIPGTIKPFSPPPIPTIKPVPPPANRDTIKP